MPNLRSFPPIKSLTISERGASTPASPSRILGTPSGTVVGGSRGLLQQRSRLSTPHGGVTPGGLLGPPSPLTILGDPTDTANSSPSASAVSTGAWPRQRSLPRAFERAKQAEEKLQQKKDLQVAAEWNECFKSAANRRDPEKLANFWTELKGRLIKRFGTVSAAFSSLKSSGGDESLSFLNFSDMLRLTHLPLDQRISRLLFEIASGGEGKLLFHDFKLALMERSVQRLRLALVSHHEKKERIHFHVQNFLSRVTQAGAGVCAASVDRFQRKLTVPFCRKLWKVLLDNLGASGTREVVVTRSLFERLLRDEIAEGNLFQNYELTYMMRIFDRVDTNAGYKPATGRVQLLSLLSALLLMSPEADRCLKVTLLFEAYDEDEDGCLLYGQILAMCQCISAQRPMADENLRGVKDFSFQEELALQQGMRYYERIRWCLQRECRVEGDVVAVRELWEALSKQQQVLEEILPSMVKVRWLATPTQQEKVAEPFSEDAAAADRGRRVSAGSIDPMSGLLTKPRRSSATLKGVPKQLLMMSSGSPQPGGRRQGTIVPLSTLERDDRKSSDMVPSFMESTGMSVTWGPLSAVDDASDSPLSLRQTPSFKESLAYGFRKALRTLSEQRIHELDDGFNQRVDLNGGEPRETINIGRARTPQGALQRNRSMVLVDASRPVSPASPASERPNSKSLHRNNSAPAIQADVLAPPGTPPTLLPRDRDLPRRGVAMSNIECERWGVSSTERFRLFSTMKSTFARSQILNDRQSQQEAENGLSFQCFLCHSYHTLSAGCFT